MQMWMFPIKHYNLDVKNLVTAEFNFSDETLLGFRQQVSVTICGRRSFTNLALLTNPISIFWCIINMFWHLDIMFIMRVWLWNYKRNWNCRNTCIKCFAYFCIRYHMFKKGWNVYWQGLLPNTHQWYWSKRDCVHTEFVFLTVLVSSWKLAFVFGLTKNKYLVSNFEKYISFIDVNPGKFW